MVGRSVGRADVIAALRGALEPAQHVLAMWEGGAAAFDRVDEWSDIDLQVLCKDGHVEEVMDAVLSAVEKLSPVDLSFRMPEPTWHGHSQVFHRLRDASEYLLLDFVVMERGSGKDRFLQPEIHGRPRIYFDKESDLTLESVDPAAHAAILRERLSRHGVLYELFRPFVQKELNRGNTIEAIGYYHAVVLRPLVEVLRIARSPLHHSFHTRYVHYELPPEDIEKLEELFYVGDATQLPAKCNDVDAWFSELLGELAEGPSESLISDVIANEAAKDPGHRRV